VNDYRTLLADSSIAGVYHLPAGAADDIVHAAAANEQAVFRIDLHEVCNKEDMLRAIGSAMHFPDWYGANFDALMDCLCDLDWRTAAGYTIILEHCDPVHGLAEDDFVTVLDIFARAATEWREQNTPLWCFVDMLADGIAFLPAIA
jgi:RNAse (barnase) inhibitor barstar